MDSEPEYNSAQRQQWLDTCAPLKNGELKAYRDCYQGEKRKASDDLRRSFSNVEERQAKPLRNIGKVPAPETAKEPDFEPPQED